MCRRPLPALQKKGNAKGESGCLRRLLQIAEERRKQKASVERKTYMQVNAESVRIARRDEKGLLRWTGQRSRGKE